MTDPFSPAEIAEAISLARGESGNCSMEDPRANIPPAENPAEFGEREHKQAPRTAIFKTPAEWPTEPPLPVDWLAFQRFPLGEVSGFVGDGGVGKTDGGLQLVANVARGAPDWFGHEIASGPAVYISAEEAEREVRRRAWLHSSKGRYSLDRLSNLHFWFPDEAEPDTLLAVPDRHGVMRPTPLFESIYITLAKIEPIAVLIDNVAATFAGNQNDRVMVRSYVNLLRKIARLPSKPAVVLLDHPSLSGLTNGTGRGGNVDWRNALRCVQYLCHPEEKADADRGIRILETKKSNYGPFGATTQLRLQWADGGLELEKIGSPLHRLAKAQECEQIFLRLLDERNAQGSHVGRGTSGMYAPKVFASSPNNGGYTKQAFASVMEQLFSAGTIKEAWDSRRRHNYIERSAILTDAAQ
jgi:RecA-family ATPase